MTEQETARYREALAYATEKHRGQSRIGGAPYISHPMAVAEIVRSKGFGLDWQITALFHDLLEDTDAAEEEILAIGGENVLRAVRLLTKRKGYVMADYVAAIRQDPIAFAVKGADRLHNLRCALCTDDEFKRRYILETIDWYMDFMPEIPPAVKALAASMQSPMTELSLLYEPVEGWELGGNAARTE